MRRRVLHCLCANGQLLVCLSYGDTRRGIASCLADTLRTAGRLPGRASGGRLTICAAACALQRSARGQATSAAAVASDKKFHCSVCFKAFRLAMAAKVHLQQAHNGEGSILDGAGPGQQPTATTSQSSQSPPPSSAQAVVAEKSAEGATEAQSATKDEPRFVPRHLRSIPKPLHEPDRELPGTVMEQLLDTWDTVGLKRLGGKFVHSSMVMKVFAGKANAGDTAGVALTATHSATTSPAAVPASSQSAKPPHTTPGATGAGAPAFPFGMMPTFVQASASTATPFAAAVASPFANAVSSPFAAAATATTAPGSSPFVNSPFVAMNAGATTTAAPSPFVPAGMAAPSPFTNMPFAAATAASAGATPSFADVSAVPLPAMTTAAASETVGEAAHPAYECPVCGRSFASHAAMRMHSRDKHHVEQPAEKLAPRRRHSAATMEEETLEIPAYVPSPVDLTATTPFGSRAQEPSWAETEVTPHAWAMSSMTVLGTVLDVEAAGPHVSTVTVYVADGGVCENDEAEGQKVNMKDKVTRRPPARTTRRATGETITLRCTGVCNDIACATLQRHDRVFACGSLRMAVVQDADSALDHAVPLVEVCMPMGMITKVSK